MVYAIRPIDGSGTPRCPPLPPTSVDPGRDTQGVFVWPGLEVPVPGGVLTHASEVGGIQYSGYPIGPIHPEDPRSHRRMDHRPRLIRSITPAVVDPG